MDLHVCNDVYKITEGQGICLIGERYGRSRYESLLLYIFTMYRI